MKNFEATLTTLAVVGALAFAVGCSSSNDTESFGTKDNTPHHSDDHGHPHDGEGGHGHGAGPHDGTLADWGGGRYHVEFTVDHVKQEATVYILGDDEKSPVPIAAEEIQLSIKDPVMQVTLKAAPQEGDPQGSASRFIGSHAGLGVVQEYEGTITGVVEDTPYSGDFKEEPHGHSGHSHGHSRSPG
ncbi:MAG: hypothetical protein MI757_16060 [Pirellulales bacterium]|nr:hypothetical protein [Pirellulales bacterium]